MEKNSANTTVLFTSRPFLISRSATGANGPGAWKNTTLINVHRAKRFFLLLAFLRLIKENLFSSCNKSSPFFSLSAACTNNEGELTIFYYIKLFFFSSYKKNWASAGTGGGRERYNYYYIFKGFLRKSIMMVTVDSFLSKKAQEFFLLTCHVMF